MTKPNTRNGGIDLLRLIAMFFVVLLHTLGQGGILKASAEGSAGYYWAWGLEIAAFCAVDLFALITGYVTYSDTPRPYRPASYFLLWLQVVFYSVGISLVFRLVWPHLAHTERPWDLLTPVRSNLYWYFTAYTGLFLLRPLLDAGLRACSDATAKKLFVAVFLLFSCYDTLFRGFQLNGGYSFAWIALVYVLGAIVRKCGIGRELRPAVGWCAAALLWAAAWAWRMWGGGLPPHRADLFVSYVSPTVLGTAVLLLILFSRLRPRGIPAAVIRFAAPGAFAAYLINNHRDVWGSLMNGRFAGLADRPAPVMALMAVSFALAFVICSVIIDRGRQLLFRLLRLDRAAARAEEAIRAALRGLTSLL